MSLAKAKDYIRELHKRQDNPYLWPDFLTGLPDKAAITHRLNEIYGSLGDYSIACVRIARIEPFLLKYGSNHHAEIIQWAAAILKTVSEDHGRQNFVGAMKIHDFVIIARSDQIEPILKESTTLFRKQTRKLYTEEDLSNGYIISFKRQKAEVRIGLMKFVHVLAKGNYGLPQGQFLPTLGDLCGEIELSGEDSLVLGPEHLTASILSN
ncbi:MAG: hypothetical protein HZA20_04695 [Nitrospirae bacterium]|nr:hypothetical protein [Nitrospirota bacterium]